MDSFVAKLSRFNHAEFYLLCLLLLEFPDLIRFASKKLHLALSLDVDMANSGITKFQILLHESCFTSSDMADFFMRRPDGNSHMQDFCFVFFHFIFQMTLTCFIFWFAPLHPG